MYLVSLLLLVAGDVVWLGFFARDFYASSLGNLMTTTPNWSAAVAFYIFYAGALVYFVIEPAVKAKSLTRALLPGAFFGFMAFATYDLTNLATLNNWPVLMSFVDVAWGTFWGGAVSGLTYAISMRFFRSLA